MDYKNYKFDVKPSNTKGTDWKHTQDSSFAGLATAVDFSSIKEFSRKTIPVFDQGVIGSCVGCSGKVVVSDLIDNANLDLSALWIYNRGKIYDGIPGESYAGTSITGACEALRKEGICLETLYPYSQTDDNIKPSDTATKDASDRIISEYYFITMDNINAIQTMLQTRSLWISFNVMDSFYNIGKDGVLDSSTYLSGKLVGGHAVSVVGWKTINDKLYWKIQNSWGPAWGDNGYFYIASDFLPSISTSGLYYVKGKSEAIEPLPVNPTPNPTTSTDASNKIKIIAYSVGGVLVASFIAYLISHYCF